MNRATFRFYEELNDFLPAERRKRSFSHDFKGTPAVLDAIEALGVPHVEVDLILVNGGSVDFARRIADGDRIAVYPEFESLDIAPATRLRERPLRDPRFILDVHLGKLARHLRLLGFDCTYDNSLDDPEIVRIAAREKRCILTRDIQLLKHGGVDRGYWIRSKDPREQTVEVLDRFDLRGAARPFTRCMVCNAAVEPVDKEAVAHRLEPKTRQYHDTFSICTGCGRIYWEGSHYRRMERLVRTFLGGRGDVP